MTETAERPVGECVVLVVVTLVRLGSGVETLPPGVLLESVVEMDDSGWVVAE